MKQPVVTSENVIQLRQMLDTTKANIKALHSMWQQTDTWDSFIIYLDSKTKLEWEIHSSITSAVLWRDCNGKLDSHVGKASDGYPPGVHQSQTDTLVTTRANDSCVVCNDSHVVKDKKLCINCLSPNHMIKQCKSRGCMPSAPQGSYCTLKETRMSHVLLATAKVSVKDRLGKLHVCCALLGIVLTTTHSINIEFLSIHTSYKGKLTCLVLPQVTNVKLADNQFHSLGDIDLLIGAEVFLNFLKLENINMKDCLTYRTPNWDISYLEEYTPPTSKVMSDNQAIPISLR
ncbi:hypothetical protein PR048_019591 [Dryococelus australis]|uniref:Uncharacterized protein n=1 Tax=Dryococelus australis TaxID=614101 RepID=A0ABQ9H3W3_9NEOP|nr:hypothetical protein PR048_019591 [Dryococelus australis]